MRSKIRIGVSQSRLHGVAPDLELKGSLHAIRDVEQEESTYLFLYPSQTAFKFIILEG